MKKKKLEEKLSKAKKKLSKVESELAGLKTKLVKPEKPANAKPAVKQATKAPVRSSVTKKKVAATKPDRQP